MSCNEAAFDHWPWWYARTLCDSEPLVCVLFLTLERLSAAHHFTAALSCVVMPRLAAVGLWLFEHPPFFHFRPMRSDIL